MKEQLTPPKARLPSEQADKEAQGEPEGLKNEEIDQVGDWLNKRAEILKQAWEKGEEFEEVKTQVVEIFKLGLAAGFKEAVVDESEKEPQSKGKFVLPEEDIDKRSFWDILTSEKDGWVMGGEVCKKLDRLLDKFDVWFSNKFLPPPEGQVLEKQGNGWQLQGREPDDLTK